MRFVTHLEGVSLDQVRPWRAVWLCSAVLILLALTVPWSNFKGHSHWSRIQWTPLSGATTGFDIAANIVLFVPFGLAYKKAEPGRAALLRVVLFSAILSVTGELLQSFSHNRIPAMTDVLMNMAGAGAGAALAGCDIRISP